MKTNILLVCALAFTLFSCGGNSQKQNVHTHDDGSTHEDHAKTDTVTKQESFKVEADTTQVEDAHNHDAHAKGHGDDHDHGHDHSGEGAHKH
jgi:hypothetical protein